MGRKRTRISQEDWRIIEQVRNLVSRRGGDLRYDENFGDQAECRDMNPVMFFPERGKSAKEGKAVCARCPVWVDCLMYSMQHRGSVDWGTYGRLSPAARAELAFLLGIKPLAIDPVQEYWGTKGWGFHRIRGYGAA